MALALQGNLGVISRKYWRELDQLKVHVFYLERYLERTVRIDRNLNMFLAIASSGSIASWVIFKDYSFIWGTVIAITQAINAVKSYLSYSKRLKSLQGITNDLESLFLTMETNWFNVSEGKLSEEDIHKLHMRYKEKRGQIIQKHLGSSPLPEASVMMEKAQTVLEHILINFIPLREYSYFK